MVFKALVGSQTEAYIICGYFKSILRLHTQEIIPVTKPRIMLV